MAPGKVLAVEEIAPDFELRDSTGKFQRLSSLTAQGSLVLLFYRGYW